MLSRALPGTRLGAAEESVKNQPAWSGKAARSKAVLETNVQHEWYHDNKGTALALLIRNEFYRPGHNFLTPPSLAFQVGVNAYGKGATVPPHRHNPVERTIDSTLEFVLLREGRAVVRLFDDAAAETAAVEMAPGDSILFVGGGHGLDLLENSVILEIKQGPYVSRCEDKTALWSVATT